jgi:hypothetical protein
MSLKEETTQCTFAMLSRDVLRLSLQPCPKTPNNDFLSKPGLFLAHVLFRNIRPHSCLVCVSVDASAQSARPSSVLDREIHATQAARKLIVMISFDVLVVVRPSPKSLYASSPLVSDPPPRFLLKPDCKR